MNILIVAAHPDDEALGAGSRIFRNAIMAKRTCVYAVEIERQPHAEYSTCRHGLRNS